MPVKIRLTRMGKKKQPTYRVVVMDSRKPRDGAYIEQIGFYDPRQDPSVIEINNDSALKWLRDGAQPTDRARKLLEISGAWMQFKVARGEIHTVAAPATPTVAEPEVAEPEVAEPETAVAAVEPEGVVAESETAVAAVEPEGVVAEVVAAAEPEANEESGEET